MNERVVITGVCGTVGRELLKYYIDKDDYIIAVDINENDIAILEKNIKYENIKFIPLDIYDEYTLNIIEKLNQLRSYMQLYWKTLITTKSIISTIIIAMSVEQ